MLPDLLDLWTPSATDATAPPSPAPGTTSHVDRRYPVRRRARAPLPLDEGAATRTAADGIAGAGTALPYRDELEAQFDADLSHLGVHVDARAAAATRALAADAYTVGDQLAFARPDPDRAVVAHEVAHALQQTRGGAGSEADDEAEAEAAEGGGAAMAARAGGAGPALRLLPSDDAATLDAGAALRHAIGRHLPRAAIIAIAQVVGYAEEQLDEFLIHAVARWQGAHGLPADGVLTDVTLTWMGLEPGGAGLGDLARRDGILYLGMNPRARVNEVATLRGRGAAITAADGNREQGVISVADGRHDLNTSEGVDGFVDELVALPENIRVRLKMLLELRTQDKARDELAEFIRALYQAETGQRLLRRVVLSGHSAGEELMGEGDNVAVVTFDQLAVLFALFPRAAGQVEDLFLSACNTGQRSRLDVHRAMFPNLQTIWAYVGYSPSGSSAGAGSNRHLAAWEGATRGTRSPARLDAARATVGRGGGHNDKHVALWTRARGADGEDHETYATASEEAEADLPTMRALVDARWSSYERALERGFIAKPALDELYAMVQNLIGMHGPSLPDLAELEHAMAQLLFLRHYPALAHNFWSRHGAMVRDAYHGIGVVPPYATQSRAATLAAIEAFPGDRGGEAYQVLTTILRDIEPDAIPREWIERAR